MQIQLYFNRNVRQFTARTATVTVYMYCWRLRGGGFDRTSRTPSLGAWYVICSSNITKTYNKARSFYNVPIFTARCYAERGIATVTRALSVGLSIGSWRWGIVLLRTKAIGSPVRSFDWCQNLRPSMILKCHYALCFKTRAQWCCYYLFLVSHSICFYAIRYCSGC